MPSTKSIVISCAGIGSRLGLATTKALVEIEGMTVIARQLQALQGVEDICVVVGYQAGDVIAEVRRYRPDIVFCYNHDYFTTKTGASFYLGARHGNDYAIELDGDLLIHPDDMRMLLEQPGEWIAYADISSDDAMFVHVDGEGNVLSFSTESGDYEWTGPACIRKDKLHYSSGHVFNMLEPSLPMRGIKVRACDIDTYDDYTRAASFVRSWTEGTSQDA